MLRLMLAEEIEQLLQQLPRIARLQEEQPAAFVARATIWLDLLEQALVAGRLDPRGRASGVRARLASVREGPPQLAREMRVQASRTRMAASAAAEALATAAELARAALAENARRFAEAEQLARQLIIAADARGVGLRGAGGRALPARVVRERIARDLELVSQLATLEALVGSDDTLVLLKRVSEAAASARVTDGG
ncbi:MAG: hypothetical protein M3N29_06855 [Chloroflexota bacterium]|nr:hypothetical protein [Chloroflexota bacterium]